MGEVLARHLGPLDVTVATEPGDFLAKECAVHLAEVVTVEDRGRRDVRRPRHGLERDSASGSCTDRTSRSSSAARWMRRRRGR